MKVNPIAPWTHDDIDGYIADHDLPEHPLERQGLPVDRLLAVHQPVAEGDDPRAGRWAGTGKTECGLHGWTPSQPS